MENLKRKIRASKFETQERLAAALDISESMLSKICRGIRQPSPELKRKIEQALKEK